jgi:hypothetical protein
LLEAIDIRGENDEYTEGFIRRWCEQSFSAPIPQNANHILHADLIEHWLRRWFVITCLKLL